MAAYTTTGVKTLSASWGGGAGRIIVSGDFSGKAKALVVINDGTGWVPVGPDGILNYPQGIRVEAASGDQIGIQISAPTGSVFTLNATLAAL